MRSTRVLNTLLLAGVMAFGCANPDGAYDPDWDAESVTAGGKADGLFDAIPAVALGGSVSGDVGGDNLELYRLALRRTDRVEITMRVTSGDLNPHLSFYRGTSVYVGSDSWRRDGDALIKTYTAEEAGTFLLAARAYQGEGEGDYEISVACLGGPCNGEFPPPSSELDVDDVEQCINAARRCAFDRLPSYNRRVGEARSNLIWQTCLDEATLGDGSSCGVACEWVNPEDERDTAASLCDDIVGALPFYADQSAACLTVLDDCMGECVRAADYGYGYFDGELAYTAEGACWQNGLNGTCDGFARSHQACGGHLLPDSAAECTELCHSTTGAHIDDLDTICSSDSWCEDSCDVDLDAAAAECGGMTAANRDCIWRILEDTSAWICEDALDDRVGSL